MGACASRPSVVSDVPTSKVRQSLDEPETFVQDSSHALNGNLKRFKLSPSNGYDSCGKEAFDLTPREKPKRTAVPEQSAAPEATTPDATAAPALQQLPASEELVAAQRSHLSAAAEESVAAVEQDTEEKPAPKPLCEEPVVAMVEHIIGAPYDVYQWGPPVPPCNDSRLKAVSQLPPVDADPDPAVDHIITLICQVFKVEAALLALFDDQRIFIRNAQGFQRGDFPWRWSFCAWCMATPNPEVLLVEDVDQDARFRDNEVAAKMGIKFYCGSPVVGSSGHRLGTLCFTDGKPRKFKAEELVILANLAELVAREVEKGAADAARKREQRQFMSRALECFATPIAFVDVSQPGWRAMHCSPAFATATGITQELASAAPLWGLLQAPAAGFDIAAAAADIAAAGNEFVLDGVTVCGDPERGSFSLRFKPAGRDQIDKHQLPVGIPAHVPSGATAAQQYFFVTLEPSGGGGPAEWLRQDSVASGLTACSALSRGTIGSILGRSSTSDSLIRSSASSSSVFSVSRSNVPSCIPVDGLTLGPLVGSGSFGRVYRGTYNGDTIAVKVCQPLGGKKSASATAAWATLEARASGRWAHPNIVRAIKHCTVLTPVDCNSRLPSLAVDSRAHSLTVPEDEALPFVKSLPDDAANGAPPLIANPFSNARCQRNADPAALAALAAAAVAQAAQPKAPVNLRFNGAKGAPSFVSPFAAGKPGGTRSPPGPSGLDSAGGPPAFAPAFTSPFAAAQRSAGSPDGPPAGPPSLRPPAISGGGGAPVFVSPFAAGKPVVSSHQGAPTFVSPFAAGKPVVPPSQGAPITSAPIASAATPLSKLPVDEMRPLESAANRMDPDSSVATLSEAAMFVGARAEASAAAEERDSTRVPSNLSTCSMGSSGRIGGAQSPFERSTFSATPFATSATTPGKPAACAGPGGAAGLTPSSVAAASAASSNPNGEFNRSDSASTAMPPQQRMQSLSPSDRSDSLGNDRSNGGSRNNSLSGSTPGSSRHCSLQNRRASMESRKNSLSIQSAGTRSALSAAGRTSSGRVATAGEVETWLLLEYCDCGSLQGGVDKGWFRRERRTRSMGGNLNVILSVARDVCSAMEYLHKEGIVHGDLAGGNVLLTSAPTPHGFCAKVSDFGLAQQVSVEGRCNTDSYGTVTHMPPEVLGGDPLTRAADVWSFGVLLWEMWCGVRAWAGLSMPQILTAIAIDRCSLQFPEGTPADFEMLATLCMSQNPLERPSFEDLHAALDKLIIRHINDDV